MLDSPAVYFESTKYKYTGKARNPKLSIEDWYLGKAIPSQYYTIKKAKGRKKVGTYTYEITFNTLYEGTAYRSFKVVPKAPTVSKLSAVEGGFKVNWKHSGEQVDGYAIEYKLGNNKIKKVKVDGAEEKNTTITGLRRGKTYQVRVKAYKVVDGKYYYSTSSGYVNVTTK